MSDRSCRVIKSRLGWLFECPGCKNLHYVDERWDFNGNRDLPTFSPSYLVHSHPAQPRCHSFVRDGRISYCADTEHELSGKTVDLPVMDLLGDDEGGKAK